MMIMILIEEGVHILSLFIRMMGQAHDPPLSYMLTPCLQTSHCILSASLLVLTFSPK